MREFVETTRTELIMIERGLELLQSDELKHGYRSDFGASAMSEETVTALQEYLTAQVDRLD